MKNEIDIDTTEMQTLEELEIIIEASDDEVALNNSGGNCDW